MWFRFFCICLKIHFIKYPLTVCRMEYLLTVKGNSTMYSGKTWQCTKMCMITQSNYRKQHFVNLTSVWWPATYTKKTTTSPPLSLAALATRACLLTVESWLWRITFKNQEWANIHAVHSFKLTILSLYYTSYLVIFESISLWRPLELNVSLLSVYIPINKLPDMKFSEWYVIILRIQLYILLQV